MGIQYDRTAFISNRELQVQENLLLELYSAAAPIVIFDIGACEGENSVRYRRLFPNSRICCFEPIPANVALVKKNLEAFGATSVEAFELCLSDTDGTANFFVSSGRPEKFKDAAVDWDFGNKSSSLLPPESSPDRHKWLEFKNNIEVPTRRLDGLMQDLQIQAIDFVHLDVQGAELMVLGGAGRRLRDIRNIWLEVEAVAFYKGQPLRNDVEVFLGEAGFVKLLDTVDSADGDQFWSAREWLVQAKGEHWVSERLQRGAGASAATGGDVKAPRPGWLKKLFG